MSESRTNFEKVREFHDAFGVAVPSCPQTRLFTEDPSLVRLRLALIREEMQELEDAVERRDLVEVLDALGDLLYVVYGTGLSFGVDLDAAFERIHASNMSKLCRTREDAVATVEWYKKQYALGDHRYDSPAFAETSRPGFFRVYNRSTGKILKNILYRPVDLAPLTI